MKLSAPQSNREARAAAFTLVEIAISLAVIAFALVAIIGVLPTGMQVQRDNREETIINQEVNYFADAIRNGARGLDELTNYVIGITIATTTFNSTTTQSVAQVTNSYLNPNPVITAATSFTLPNVDTTFPLDSGQRIIGLLGTPKYSYPTNQIRSNYVVAYVRALSGLAVEKFPQDNKDVGAAVFAYRLICENQAVPAFDGASPYGKNLVANLRELRLTFRYPLKINGDTGNGRQVFRLQVGGQLQQVNDGKQALYFFQPTTFVKAP